MFTSEPSLSQRIERKIRETPIVDPHSRLRSDRPKASDLASLLSRDSVRVRLTAVGMSAADFDPALPVEERVLRAIPHLPSIRNTAAYWTLFRIFRDLYDFHDPVLTRENYKPLLDAVAASAADPGWAGRILRENCNLRTIVTGLSNKSDADANGTATVRYMLELDDLLAPNGDPAAYSAALSAFVGEVAVNRRRLERDLYDRLDALMVGDVRFAKAAIPSGRRLVEPDEQTVAGILNRLGEGHLLDAQEVEELARFTTWTILAWHHERRKPLRLVFGGDDFIGGTALLRDIARAAGRFPEARLDLLVGAESLARKATVLAADLPNVTLAGDGGRNFVPPIIERNTALRLQLVPMTKWTGFVSDADQVEWIYGRFQAARKAIARACASVIEAGYHEEDEIPPILRQVLHDSPTSILQLG